MTRREWVRLESQRSSLCGPSASISPVDAGGANVSGRRRAKSKPQDDPGVTVASCAGGSVSPFPTAVSRSCARFRLTSRQALLVPLEPTSIAAAAHSHARGITGEAGDTWGKSSEQRAASSAKQQQRASPRWLRAIRRYPFRDPATLPAPNIHARFAHHAAHTPAPSVPLSFARTTALHARLPPRQRPSRRAGDRKSSRCGVTRPYLRRRWPASHPCHRGQHQATRTHPPTHPPGTSAGGRRDRRSNHGPVHAASAHSLRCDMPWSFFPLP